MKQSAFDFANPAASDSGQRNLRPFKTQLLKWVGNKQRFAHEIVSYFPTSFDRYIEPFLGSGAVLATLAPSRAVAGDALSPLASIWKTLVSAPATLDSWYSERFQLIHDLGKEAAYDRVRTRFNNEPNPADLLFLSRTCYGGVVRFRRDGQMSTPCGVHQPISPEAFLHRVKVWHARFRHTEIRCCDFEELIDAAGAGDVVYCDPPYSHTQSILYGAQAFSLGRLFAAIERAKKRGAFVALSIDGTKKSGRVVCDVGVPRGLFAREKSVNCGSSMLRRFQVGGQSVEFEVVSDRLLMTH